MAAAARPGCGRRRWRRRCGSTWLRAVNAVRVAVTVEVEQGLGVPIVVVVCIGGARWVWADGTTKRVVSGTTRFHSVGQVLAITRARQSTAGSRRRPRCLRWSRGRQATGHEAVLVLVLVLMLVLAPLGVGGGSGRSWGSHALLLCRPLSKHTLHQLVAFGGALVAVGGRDGGLRGRWGYRRARGRCVP